MSYKFYLEAVRGAPEDADFIAYLADRDCWKVLARTNGQYMRVADLDSFGYSIFVSGASARGKALWSHESKQFITGDVGQLSRAEEA